MFEMELSPDYKLTTKHPQSSYGISVLLNTTTGMAYGPSDDMGSIMIPAMGRLVSESLSAGFLVRTFAKGHPCTDEEMRFIKLFLMEEPG